MAKLNYNDILKFLQKRETVAVSEICSHFDLCLSDIESMMFEMEKKNQIRIENSTCQGNCGSCLGCDSQNASIDPISLSSVIVMVKGIH